VASSDSGPGADRPDGGGAGGEPRVLSGRYRLEERLGAGGSGEIWRATQLDLGREVALKLLLSSQMASPADLKRFHREARLAQKLEHPNTVRLYDMGQTEAGTPFIVYQLLHGSSLSDVLEGGGALPPARVVRIASQVLKSLMEAHRYGIVHRDIKPENIFLSDVQGEPDFVKVLDFGIAKPTGPDGEDLAATGPDEIIGTPNYMAPEQVLGEAVGPETDLYALGLVMAEMLTGQLVFGTGSPLAVLKAHLSKEPIPLPDALARAPLGMVIRRATARSMADRYHDAGEMLAALEVVGTDAGASERAPQGTASHGRRLWPVWLGVGLVVAVAVLGVLLVVFGNELVRVEGTESDRAGPGRNDDEPMVPAPSPPERPAHGEQRAEGSDAGSAPATEPDHDHSPPPYQPLADVVERLTVERVIDRLTRAGWTTQRRDDLASETSEARFLPVVEISRGRHEGRVAIVHFRSESIARTRASYHNQGLVVAASGGRTYLGVSVFDSTTEEPLRDEALAVLRVITE